MFRSMAKVAAEKEAEASCSEDHPGENEHELQAAEPKEHLRPPVELRSATGRLKLFHSVRRRRYPAVVRAPAVQVGSPASEQEVDRRGADNRCVGDRESCRVEQKRPRLRAAQP